MIARSSILVIASHSETLLANMCNRCLLLEHGQILSDGPAKSLLETYRASVIESARADDADALHRAYMLATDMVKNGQNPPLALEEQGLRYALTVSPDDTAMLQRYMDVLTLQKKGVPSEIEERLLMSLLGKNPSRDDLKTRLATLRARNDSNATATNA